MTRSAVKREVRRGPAGRGVDGAGSTAWERQAPQVLLRVSQAVGGDLDLGVVLRTAIDATTDAMNAEACSILLRAADAEELYFHSVKGEHATGLGSKRLPIDDRSLAGWVANHDQILAVPDAYQDSRFNPEYDRRTGFRTRAVACAPLHVRSRRLGVIQVLNRRDGQPFDATDCELLEAVASLVAVAIDNAEQHEARVKAERLAAVGQTVAGLAHCVKNVLNGLQAGSQVLERELRGQQVSAGIARGWGIVSRNLQFLSNIVLDMLSYSKPRQPLRQPCPVGELCQDVVELLRPQASEAGVALSVRGASEIGDVDLDETAMRRCLINLAGNAVDACRGRPDGQVTLDIARLAGSPERLQLRITDNGCGMSDEVRSRLFEPLFSTKGSKGTGLGLAVARKIVLEHGGTLSVDSSPGAGTVFTLDLPLT